MFSKLTMLKKLHLHDNQIKRLLSGIFTKLTRLKELQLHSNIKELSIVFTEFSEMTKLKRL